jgi:hypothetical protein
MKNAYTISVRKPKGKRLLGRSKCKWKGNIKMNLKEIRCEGEFSWGPVAGSCEHGNEPLISIRRVGIS